MIPKRALFSNLRDSKDWSSHFNVKHYKFFQNCVIQENLDRLIFKRNIKTVRTLKLKASEGNIKNQIRMANAVNCLCKKNLRTTKLKLSHRAIPTNHTKIRFFGFKMLKNLKTLDIDLILYPKRSKGATNWTEMFQFLVNYSKKLKSLSLAYKNSYCMRGELKSCFSRLIRARSVENLELIVRNPPISGNPILKGSSYLLYKMPNIKRLGLKGGYSGLKVDSETYLHFLKAAYKLRYISHLNLDFNISFIKRNLKPEQAEEFRLPSRKIISSLTLNVKIRSNILRYLKEIIDSVPELKELDLKMINKDCYESGSEEEDWKNLIDSISEKKKLKQLSLECKLEKKNKKSLERNRLSRLLGWTKEKFSKLCLRRKEKLALIQQNEHLAERLMEIPRKLKELKVFSLAFPFGARVLSSEVKS